MKKLVFGVVALAMLGLNASSQSNTDKTFKDNVQGQNIIQDNAGGQGGVVNVYKSEEFSRNAVFCDDFNRPNNTTVTNWTEQSGNWQINNNELQTPGAYAWQFITADGTAQTDGCVTVRAIYGSPAEVKFVGAVGRYTNDNTRLLFKIQDNNDAGYWDSYWVYDNGSLPLWNDAGTNFGTDAIIQMEYSGANVTIRIDVNSDGTWDYTNSTAVSNTGNGLCGIGAYGYAFADDFCSGSDCTNISVPLSNYALLFALLLIAGFLTYRYFRKV